MGSFVLRVEGDSLQMVSFRVKVWVTYVVFLSSGIFHSQQKAIHHLSISVNHEHFFGLQVLNCVFVYICYTSAKKCQ